MLKKNYKVASTEGRKKKKTTRKQQFAEFVVVVFVRPVRGSFCCFHGQCISMITHHIVKSMIALTISLWQFLLFPRTMHLDDHSSHCQVHDSVANIVVALLESLDRFALAAIGLLHNELDVLRLDAFLVHLLVGLFV